MQNATLEAKYLVAKANVKIAFLSSVCRTAHAHKSVWLIWRDFSSPLLSQSWTLPRTEGYVEILPMLIVGVNCNIYSAAGLQFSVCHEVCLPLSACRRARPRQRYLILCNASYSVWDVDPDIRFDREASVAHSQYIIYIIYMCICMCIYIIYNIYYVYKNISENKMKIYIKIYLNISWIQTKIQLDWKAFGIS